LTPSARAAMMARTLPAATARHEMGDELPWLFLISNQ
jgi:hypothetical protein